MTASTRPKPKATHEPTPGPTDFRRMAERLKQGFDLTRLRVLLLLGDGERSVGDLRSEISCSMTAISRHPDPAEARRPYRAHAGRSAEHLRPDRRGSGPAAG